MVCGAKVASRWFEERYAKLVLSMSMGEAKEILGFPPSAVPTAQEVSKAWKQKAFENHPDRGGSHEKMVEINVAKDILEGKTRAQWKPEAPPPPSPKREPPKVVDTVVGEPFEKMAADLPGNVEWKFVSSQFYGKALDGYTSSHWAWILVGVTDDKYVVATIKVRHPSQFLSQDKGGFVNVEQDWKVNLATGPVGKDPGKAIPALIKGTLGFSDASFDMPKKWTLWKADKPTQAILEAIRHGAGVALKDVLIGAGMTSGEVSGRKTVIEFYGKYNREKHKKLREQGGRFESAMTYDVFVRVNGKEYALSDETVKKLIKNHFMFNMSYEIPEHPKNITKMRGGTFKADARYMIGLLADAAKGTEPASLVSSLEKAVSEYVPSKAAQVIERFLQ